MRSKFANVNKLMRRLYQYDYSRRVLNELGFDPSAGTSKFDRASYIG